MWKNASWILHHDNAPAHNALSVKRYLAKNNIPVMEHPPYSPDLAPSYFFLFPKIKSALKGTRFESVDAVKAKATQLLNSITQDDLQHCFEQRKIRMEWVEIGKGITLKVITFQLPDLFFSKGLEHESGFFIATPCIIKRIEIQYLLYQVNRVLFDLCNYIFHLTSRETIKNELFGPN